MIEPDGYYDEAEARRDALSIPQSRSIFSVGTALIIRSLSISILFTMMSSFLMVPVIRDKNQSYRFYSTDSFQSIRNSIPAHYRDWDVEQVFLDGTNPTSRQHNKTSRLRVLYIVTSSNRNRWNDLVLPVLQLNVESLLGTKSPQMKFSTINNSISHLEIDVDLYLILSYHLELQEKQELRSILPWSVGIEIWANSTPYKYKCNEWSDSEDTNVMMASSMLTAGRSCLPHTAKEWESRTTHFMNETRLINGIVQLARQHRFVIKDKMEYYDFFLAWEDDMIVKKSHLDQHVKIMDMINKLRKNMKLKHRKQSKKNTQTGEILSDDILSRMRPGFIRTEALQPSHGNKGTREDILGEWISRMKSNSSFKNTNPKEMKPNASLSIISSICCCIPDHLIMPTVAEYNPPHHSLIVWESFPLGFSLRQWGDKSLSSNNSNSRQLPYDENDWIATMNFGLPNFPATWVGKYRHYYNFNPHSYWNQSEEPPLLGSHEGFNDYIAQAAVRTQVLNVYCFSDDFYLVQCEHKLISRFFGCARSGLDGKQG